MSPIVYTSDGLRWSRCEVDIGNEKRAYVHEWSSSRLVGDPEVES